MKTHNYLATIFLSLLIISCGPKSGEKKNDFTIKTNTKENSISNSETLNLSIENPKNHVIDSVIYSLNGKSIKETFSLQNEKLGSQTIQATVYFNNEHQTVTSNIIILNNESPKIYTYKVVNEYPHDITSYTQGLEFFNDTLYESTGQHKESKLRKLDYKTGNVLKNIHLADEYFGEGLSVLNNKIYQLTWQGGLGFVYDVNTFDKINTFKYGKSKEGWGLCNDDKTRYKSDGTEHIWLLNL